MWIKSLYLWIWCLAKRSRFLASSRHKVNERIKLLEEQISSCIKNTGIMRKKLYEVFDSSLTRKLYIFTKNKFIPLSNGLSPLLWSKLFCTVHLRFNYFIKLSKLSALSWAQNCHLKYSHHEPTSLFFVYVLIFPSYCKFLKTIFSYSLGL